MMRTALLLGGTLIVVLITACSTPVEPKPEMLCDVHSFQPSGIGSYWVYETRTMPSGQVDIDSMIIVDTASTATSSSYSVKYFINGVLSTTFTSGFTANGGTSPYLIEGIPGMFYDLRTPWQLRDFAVTGPVLYCGTMLLPISVYLPLDSVMAVDSLGNPLRVGVQYRVVTDGSHTTGTVAELSTSMPSPSVAATTPIRVVDIVATDTVNIQEPYYATFPSGKRSYSSTTVIRRVYAWDVGMLTESMSQKIGEPSTTGIKTVERTRRLLRYGQVK